MPFSIMEIYRIYGYANRKCFSSKKYSLFSFSCCKLMRTRHDHTGYLPLFTSKFYKFVRLKLKLAQSKINDYHQHISFLVLLPNNRRHLLKDFWNMIGSYILWHKSSWFYNEIFSSPKWGGNSCIDSYCTLPSMGTQINSYENI